MARLRKVVQFVKILFGVASDAKRAADDASSQLHENVQRVRETVDAVTKQQQGGEIPSDADFFAVLAHDMRNEEQRRIVERGE